MRFLRQTSRSVQGVLCLLFALVCLTASDAIIKWLSSHYPLHEITFIRALVGLILVLVFAHCFGGLSQLRTQRIGLHLLRGSLLVLANVFFFLGLSVMSMATTVTLFYCAPFFICLIAKVILGEPVGFQRWLAIGVGMVGVVIIAQPGNDDFSWSVFLPVLAALTYSLMVMLTRKMAMSDSAGSMSFFIQVSFISLSLLSGLFVGHGQFNVFDEAALEFLLRAWYWPEFAHLKLFIICGVAAAAGAHLLSQSYRLAQASVVAPFEYASLPFAIAVGFLVWGDLPGLRDYLGSALIVFSGLAVLYIDVRIRRKMRTPTT